MLRAGTGRYKLPAKMHVVDCFYKYGSELRGCA